MACAFSHSGIVRIGEIDDWIDDCKFRIPLQKHKIRLSEGLLLAAMKRNVALTLNPKPYDRFGYLTSGYPT